MYLLVRIYTWVQKSPTSKVTANTNHKDLENKEVLPKSSPASVISQISYQKEGSFSHHTLPIGAPQWTLIKCIPETAGESVRPPLHPHTQLILALTSLLWRAIAWTSPLRLASLAPASPEKKTDLQIRESARESLRPVLSDSLTKAAEKTRVLASPYNSAHSLFSFKVKLLAL